MPAAVKNAASVQRITARTVSFPGSTVIAALSTRLTTVPRSASHRVRRHEAADDNAAAVMDVPHHGFADRVALITNDRALGHLHPLSFDRNPIGAGANVVGGAMSVRLIAAW